MKLGFASSGKSDEEICELIRVSEDREDEIKMGSICESVIWELPQLNWFETV